MTEETQNMFAVELTCTLNVMIYEVATQAEETQNMFAVELTTLNVMAAEVVTRAEETQNMHQYMSAV